MVRRVGVPVSAHPASASVGAGMTWAQYRKEALSRGFRAYVDFRYTNVANDAPYKAASIQYVHVATGLRYATTIGASEHVARKDADLSALQALRGSVDVTVRGRVFEL